MDLLFVMDPLARIHPDKDTTFDLMVAAERRGHRVYWCEQTELLYEQGRILARARQVQLLPGKSPHFAEQGSAVLALTDIGATFMRKDPPVDVAFMQATLLLWHAHHHGARIYNRPDALLMANEKLYALRFPEWIPETLVTARIDEARAFANAHGRVVVKPIDGNGGRAVFVVDGADSNLAPIVETLTGEGQRHCIVQRYLPAVAAGDKRIILIDGEPVGALNRVPQGGEHRANLHVGGKAVATEISERERAICAAIAPSLKRDGLLFVGIDVIGGYLTEVNVTSPTGLQEIRALSGLDLAPRVIAALEANAAAPDATPAAEKR